MTEDGAFAAIRFEGTARSGKQLFDYCDRRARQGYSAPAGSPGTAGRTGLFVVPVVRGKIAAVWPQRHDDV